MRLEVAWCKKSELPDFVHPTLKRGREDEPGDAPESEPERKIPKEEASGAT